MAGHSKWANIKRKKGVIDAKRGKVFTKLIRELQTAARLGGGDVSANPRLRDAITEAKSQNMPKDTIERAVKRGAGGLEGQNYEECVYEGYGPGGVAIIMESLTDNRNRTVAEIRNSMTKNGGNLGESGSVAWIFEKKGIIALSKSQIEEEALMELALEAGAEDISEEGDTWEVHCPPTAFSEVKKVLEEKGLKLESSAISALPKNSVALAGDDAARMLKLMDVLEDLDDIQKVYANFDIAAEELEKLL